MAGAPGAIPPPTALITPEQKGQSGRGFPKEFGLYEHQSNMMTTDWHLGPDAKTALYTVSHIGGFGVNWMQMLHAGPDSSGTMLGCAEVKSIIGSGKYQLTLSPPGSGRPPVEQMLRRSKGLLGTTYAFTHRVGAGSETFEWRGARHVETRAGEQARGWALTRLAHRGHGDKGVVATCVPVTAGGSTRAEFRLLATGGELDEEWGVLVVLSMMKVLHDHGMKRSPVHDIRELSRQIKEETKTQEQARKDAAAAAAGAGAGAGAGGDGAAGG